MKTLFLTAAIVFGIGVTAQHANAQCCGQPAVAYYAPAPTMSYYAPTTAYSANYAPAVAYYPPATAYNGVGYYGRGAFGTGLGGWRGARGINRRYDRRNPVTIQPY